MPGAIWFEALINGRWTPLSRSGFPFASGSNLSFRAEAFNIFNHPQYGMPASAFSSPATFGAITAEANTTAIGTGTPRELQFALRLEF